VVRNIISRAIFFLIENLQPEDAHYTGVKGIMLVQHLIVGMSLERWNTMQEKVELKWYFQFLQEKRGDESTMDTETNCVIICTHLRNMGFDEYGVLSIIPDSLLLDVVRRWNFNPQEKHLSKHLLDYNYLERVEGGYRLTGADL